MNQKHGGMYTSNSSDYDDWNTRDNFLGPKIDLVNWKKNTVTQHHCFFSTRVFPKIEVPQNGWFLLENPIING